MDGPCAGPTGVPGKRQRIPNNEGHGSNGDPGEEYVEESGPYGGRDEHTPYAHGPWRTTLRSKTEPRFSWTSEFH